MVDDRYLMTMQLYNSKTRKKELFEPLDDKKVKMYVCGITPYDTTHLGHAFTYVSFDVLRRYLQYKGYNVNYVQNVTDIDDDILRKAREVGKNWQELGNFWTNKFLNDLKALNIKLPDHYVKATDSIPKMIGIIKTLIEKGYAYINQRNVYFKANKFKTYGQLSKFNEKQMLLISKERGGNPNDPLKKHPLDFLLWQKSKENEPAWQSPWSKGRPGWHIECSAMINQYLGDQIDIHGGGHDLIFPHHESEIAQSECYTEKIPFVKYWLHTGMLLYQGEKMAKSLGNLVMVSDLLKNYCADVIRFVLVSHHYREAWEFTDENLQYAEKVINKIKKALNNNINYQTSIVNDKIMAEFEKFMDDDLDTPKVRVLIENLVEKILKEKKEEEKKKLQATLSTQLSILGFKLE